MTKEEQSMMAPYQPVKPLRFLMHLLPYGRDIVSTEIQGYRGWDNDKTSAMLNLMNGDVPRVDIEGGGFMKKNATTNDALLFNRAGHPPLFVDIGANVGWFTLVMASAGHRVISIEPLQHNELSLRFSLCRNPGFTSRVRLYPVALGAEVDQQCVVYSENRNVGDGHVLCRTQEEHKKAMELIRQMEMMEEAEKERKKQEDERKATASPPSTAQLPPSSTGAVTNAGVRDITSSTTDSKPSLQRKLLQVSQRDVVVGGSDKNSSPPLTSTVTVPSGSKRPATPSTWQSRLASLRAHTAATPNPVSVPSASKSATDPSLALGGSDNFVREQIRRPPTSTPAASASAPVTPVAKQPSQHQQIDVIVKSQTSTSTSTPTSTHSISSEHSNPANLPPSSANKFSPPTSSQSASKSSSGLEARIRGALRPSQRSQQGQASPEQHVNDQAHVPSAIQRPPSPSPSPSPSAFRARFTPAIPVSARSHHADDSTHHSQWPKPPTLKQSSNTLNISNNSTQNNSTSTSNPQSKRRVYYTFTGVGVGSNTNGNQRKGTMLRTRLANPQTLSSTALLRQHSESLTRLWNTTGSIPKGYMVRNELRMTRLDSLVSEGVLVMKIDVEGFESHVLRGAGRLFDEHEVRYIIAEYSPDMLRAKGGDPIAFLTFFHRRGYDIRHLSAKGFDLRRQVTPTDFDKFCTSKPGMQCEVLMAKKKDLWGA